MPIGTAAAILGGAAIGGLSGIFGSGKAAKAQEKAANTAAQTQEDIFNKQTALQEPFRQAGIAGNNQLLTLLGLNGGDKSSASFDQYGSDKSFAPSDLTSDPGYQFRLSEGLKALNNSMAAQGRGISGANLKAAENYGQQAGSQEYQNAFNRYQVNRSNALNPLQSISGAGQTSANVLTGAAGQLGSGLANAQLEAGNARASGYVGGTNALTSALGQGINAYTGYQAQQPLNNYLNSLTNTGGRADYGSGTYGGYANPGSDLSWLDQPLDAGSINTSIAGL